MSVCLQLTLLDASPRWCGSFPWEAPSAEQNLHVSSPQSVSCFVLWEKKLSNLRVAQLLSATSQLPSLTVLFSASWLACEQSLLCFWRSSFLLPQKRGELFGSWMDEWGFPYLNFSRQETVWWSGNAGQPMHITFGGSGGQKGDFLLKNCEQFEGFKGEHETFFVLFFPPKIICSLNRIVAFYFLQLRIQAQDPILRYNKLLLHIKSQSWGAEWILLLWCTFNCTCLLFWFLSVKFFVCSSGYKVSSILLWWHKRRNPLINRHCQIWGIMFNEMHPFHVFSTFECRSGAPPEAATQASHYQIYLIEAFILPSTASSELACFLHTVTLPQVVFESIIEDEVMQTSSWPALVHWRFCPDIFVLRVTDLWSLETPSCECFSYKPLESKLCVCVPTALLYPRSMFYTYKYPQYIFYMPYCAHYIIYTALSTLYLRAFTSRLHVCYKQLYNDNINHLSK